MDKRQADKLKTGDFVIGPKFGIIEPRAIDRIVTRESHPKERGNLPLIGFADSPDLYTYLGLIKVPVCPGHGSVLVNDECPDCKIEKEEFEE